MIDTTTTRYKLQYCIQNIKLVINDIRRQSISLVDNRIPHMTECLEKLLTCEEIKELSPVLLENFLMYIDAYENKDYLLAADYLNELLVKPLEEFAAEYTTQLPQPDCDDTYQVEYTSSASMTLAKVYNGKKIYLHSNLCPMDEANELCHKWQKIGVERYIVAGLGFGYHIAKLLENSLVTVCVFEEDARVIELAKKWSDVGGIFQTERVRIVHDPNYVQFVKMAEQYEKEKKSKICIYYPSVRTINHSVLKKRMSRLFLQMDNNTRWENHFMLNFSSNVSYVRNEVSELTDTWRNKTVYLIAGGPSLDLNIAQLKGRSEDTIVLTVGTSFKRCLAENINPDYVIITDPKDGVYMQISGVEDAEIPMLLLSTTYAKVAKIYKGQKYLIFQKGYNLAEEFAKQNNYRMHETGGSVVTTALDVCIRMQVKRVVFLGLDLAFTGGKSHQGMKTANMISKSEFLTEDIDGNMVVTSQNLTIYREWIEERIEKAKKDGCQTEFIDASEGGAKIAGTTIMKLRECL